MRPFPMLPLLALAACFSDPADEQPAAENTAPPPPMVCEQVREALEKLSKGAALVYADDGTAVVEEQIWARMGGGGRDQLTQALGFHAACAAGESSSEQRIVVRNQMGTIVSQRTVDSRVNTGMLFGE